MSTSDPTFSKYTNKHAQKYAKERTSYSQKLYDIIIEHHVKTGGALNTLVDVGCGPGNATRDLALSFDTAIGLDPGQEMINAARQLAGVSSTGKKIEYGIASAEELSQAVRAKGLLTSKNGVDLVTAAMAVCLPRLGISPLLDSLCWGYTLILKITANSSQAHWFDMPKFWTEVARILNPGGTVALWTRASLYCRELKTAANGSDLTRSRPIYSKSPRGSKCFFPARERDSCPVRATTQSDIPKFIR